MSIKIQPMGILILILLTAFSYSDSNSKNQPIDNVQCLVEKGDILRNEYSNSPTINLYQGNGRFGSCFGRLGLHNKPEKVHGEKQGNNRFGRTQFMHMNHKVRGKFGADYLIPMGKIYWKDSLTNISQYKQHQKMFDGTISTSFQTGQNKIDVKTWFDGTARDMAVVSIKIDKKPFSVIYDPQKTINVHYNQQFVKDISISKNGDFWKVSTTCAGFSSDVIIKTSCTAEEVDGKLKINLEKGKNNIFISLNNSFEKTVKESLEDTQIWWANKWGNSAWLDLPDDNAQKMWIRSMAQFFFTCGNDNMGMPPPMGLSGNGWPFPFPQDISYINPVMLITGNTDISKTWVEYMSTRLKGMKDYTRRLLKVDGVICPWVFPYNQFSEYHAPVPPNVFYYETHNSGYLCRMAYETAAMIDDEEWTRKYALPVVKETAIFYKSISKKEADGLWHVFVEPSMGQDETGGQNQKDYLCALYSAKYCFQKAIEYGLDTNGEYQQILKDNLAFESLVSQRDYYFSCQGSGEKDFGNQKHPPQLNELAFLPVSKKSSNQALNAYNIRYEITRDAEKPHFYGWTLGEFLLAGTRLGDVDSWKKDWDKLLPSAYVDEEFIQIFETSRVQSESFYTTTNGLTINSLLDGIVTTWWGKLEIAKCLPWEGKVSFGNIRTLLGVVVDGRIENGIAELNVTAWKDCSIDLHGEGLNIKKGETISRIVDLKLGN
ncbi:MAG: hypothetical protein JXQ96_18390 [Cyclobacteriaceae bacterium]